MKKLTDDIINIGVNDFQTDLFEGQYKVPNGISYNSYVVIDEQLTVIDTVDERFADEWFANINKAIGDKTPDYLIIQHMEPDHSGSVHKFTQKYPNTKVVANAKTFAMLCQFFSENCVLNSKVVKDGETLTTGKHEFKFVFAPMVHWPEVMLTYDSYSKVLFSADAFGTFGVYEDEKAVDVNEWADEAARYFIGIVGKYGAPVQTLLKKAAQLDIQKIFALHGPALTSNLGDFINLYDTWSSYKAEKEGVVIAYASAYGNTEKAALLLEKMLQEKGVENIQVFDLARCDMSKAVAESFRNSKLILASITYNAGLSPFMHTFINGLIERNYQNRTVAIIENSSWAPAVIKTVNTLFEKSKNISVTKNNVSFKSSLNETDKENIALLCDEII